MATIGMARFKRWPPWENKCQSENDAYQIPIMITRQVFGYAAVLSSVFSLHTVLVYPPSAAHHQTDGAINVAMPFRPPACPYRNKASLRQEQNSPAHNWICSVNSGLNFTMNQWIFRAAFNRN